MLGPVLLECFFNVFLYHLLRQGMPSIYILTVLMNNSVLMTGRP